MNRKTLTFCTFLLVFSILSIEISAKEITDSDKEAIILSIFSKTDFEKSDDENVIESKMINLSTKNLPQFLNGNLLQIKNLRISLLNSNELKSGINNHITYWRFSEFEVKNETVSVSLTTEFAGGNSFTADYAYKKHKGKWKGKKVGWSALAS